MVIKIGYVDGRLVAYDPADYPTSRYPRTYTPTKYGTHISTTPTREEWKPSGTEVMTEHGGMTLTPEAYKEHLASEKKKQTLQQARATFAPRQTPAYSQRATLTTPESVQREGLDWAKAESGVIKPPIEFKRLSRYDYPSEAAYLGARAMRGATSAIVLPINIPFYAAEFGRRWYRAGEHGREFLVGTGAQVASGLVRTAREDPLGLAAEVGGGMLGGAAVSGTISDIKAAYTKPKLIDVRGQSVSRVAPTGKGSVGETGAVYASKVGKKEIITKVKSRFIAKPVDMKKTGIVSGGKAETFVKEKTFFGATRIKKVKSDVVTAGVSSKLSSGDFGNIFTSMTRAGEKVKGYFGVGLSKVKSKVGDTTIYDTASFMKDVKDPSGLARVYSRDMVIKTSSTPPIEMFKPSAHTPLFHKPITDVRPVVDVGLKAHVDVVKAVSESARPSLLPLGAISLKPKSKPVKATTSLIPKAISLDKQSSLDLSDLSKSMIAPAKTRQLTTTKPRVTSSQLFKQFSGFVSRQAQSQVTLPLQSQVTLTKQKQLSGQRQILKTVQLAQPKQTSISLPSLVTPTTTFSLIPPISSSGFKTARAPRRRKSKKFRGSKRRSELLPLSDWLSVTETEIKLFEKARHPRVTRETRSMFKRRLRGSLATLRFPTSQQLRRKRKRKKRRKKKKRR